MEERSGDCLATDLGGGTDPGWAVEGKGMGKEGGRGLGLRTPIPWEPSPQLPNSFGMVPKEGRSRLGAVKKGNKGELGGIGDAAGRPTAATSRLHFQMDHYCSREVAGKDVVVKSEGDPQGGRGQDRRGGWPPEERRPETAAPQPRADNPEGDEELGGEVPQGWGICGGKKEEELPGKRVAK
ncbi:hypothetical protein BY996DRAFT_6426597 [Phakopsora pachyrhizi]|nr:hypothetical protein BY996DRAFT_6426597 [Phakopsora pachyrhizi]